MKTKDYYLDTTRLEEVVYNSYCYTDLVLNKDIIIPFLALGSNGVFAFIEIPNNKKPMSYLTETVRKVLDIHGQTIYFFLIDDINCLLADKGEKSYTNVDDVYDAFDNLYNNTMRPYTDLVLLDFKDYISMTKEPVLPDDIDLTIDDTGDPTYIKAVLTDKQIDHINEAIIHQIDSKNKYRTDGEGNEYILRSDVSGIGIGDKKWYRLSPDDPNDVLKYTLIGGWFGLHKFKEGDIFNGIIYLLTCGVFGVGYVFDILSLLIGTRSYKETILDTNGYKFKDKIYYKALSNKIVASICLVVSIILSFILLNTLYKWGYTQIMSIMIGSASKYAEANPDTASDMVSSLHNILR